MAFVYTTSLFLLAKVAIFKLTGDKRRNIYVLHRKKAAGVRPFGVLLSGDEVKKHI